MISPILAQAVEAGVTGNIAVAAALLSAPIGIGIIGNKASEAVARNPGASTKILIQSILAMALAEGLAILAIFLV